MAVLLENPRRRRRARRSSRRRVSSRRRRRSNPVAKRRKRSTTKRRRSRIGGKIGGANVQRILMQAATTAASFWAASFSTRVLVNKFPYLNTYNPNMLQALAGIGLIAAKGLLPGAVRRYATPVGIGLTASGILGWIQGTGANSEQVADKVVRPVFGPPLPPGSPYALRSTPVGVAGDDLLGADAMLFGGPELLGLGYDDPNDDLDGLGFTSFGGRA